jgi:hypothetical protein
VVAALALINVFRWNHLERKFYPNAKFGVGRRMTTSPSNKVSPSTDVTPDLVLQREQAGTIGEITYSLANDNAHWRGKLEQIVKYDDPLVGWWSEDERLESHDVAFLVPQSRAVRVGDILKAEAEDEAGTIKLKCPVAVVGFSRTSGAKEFMTLMKMFGDLGDADLSERLRHGIPVPTDILIVEYGDRKFFDFEPPMAYLLQIMWDQLFPTYLSEFPAEANDKRFTAITVTVDRVTEGLQNNYGFAIEDERCSEIPQKTWVKKALELLVLFNLASRGEGNTYTIRYRTLRGDHLKRFGELIHRNRGKSVFTASAPGEPMLLPFPNEEVETASDGRADPKPPDGTGQES